MFLGVFLQLFVLLYNRLYHKTGSRILFEVGNQYTLELNVTNIGVVKKAKNNSIDNCESCTCCKSNRDKRSRCN